MSQRSGFINNIGYFTARLLKMRLHVRIGLQLLHEISD